MPTIEREIRTGETKRVGNFEITPQTNLLKVQLTPNHGGLIWNRPRAVIVRTPDGHESIMPVRDVTRIAIWAMLAGGLLGTMLIGMMYRSMVRKNKEE